MNIYQHIEQAVQNAPSTNKFNGSSTDFSLFTGKDDDFLVHINKDTLPDLPNEVTLDMEQDEGLRKLLEAYRDVTGLFVSPTYIEYAEKHEGQHFKAAKYLGVISARVGIRFFNIQQPGQESQLGLQPFVRMQDFKTTKLGAALVSAYPIPPSPGDEIDIQGYGYSGVEELADIAMRRNRERNNLESGLFYPVPMSFTVMSTRRSLLVPEKIDYL